MRRTILEPQHRFNASVEMEATVATRLLKFQLVLILLGLVAQTGRKKKARRKRKGIYTTSQVNSIIDATVHPLADQHWIFVAADGLLHAANESEGDPIETLLKFVKYNMPELLRRLLKQLRE